jgi:hypothetical protein
MSDSQSSGRGRWFASSAFGMFTLGVALALGFAWSSQSISRAMVAMRTASTIKVKGTASVDVSSDLARWSCTISAEGKTPQEAYARLNTSLQRVQRYIVGSGFAPADLTVGAVRTETTHAKDAKGNQTNRIESYTLSQAVSMSSAKVTEVKTLSERVTDLIQEGVSVASAAPEFMLANPEAMKSSLLAEATGNAMERAQTLAKGSGSSVGSLQSASQGLIQILPRGAVSSEWGRDYDTSTIDKTMRVVVSLEYAVQ